MSLTKMATQPQSTPKSSRDKAHRHHPIKALEQRDVTQYLYTALGKRSHHSAHNTTPTNRAYQKRTAPPMQVNHSVVFPRTARSLVRICWHRSALVPSHASAEFRERTCGATVPPVAPPRPKQRSTPVRYALARLFADGHDKVLFACHRTPIRVPRDRQVLRFHPRRPRRRSSPSILPFSLQISLWSYGVHGRLKTDAFSLALQDRCQHVEHVSSGVRRHARSLPVLACVPFRAHSEFISLSCTIFCRTQPLFIDFTEPVTPVRHEFYLTLHVAFMNFTEPFTLSFKTFTEPVTLSFKTFTEPITLPFTNFTKPVWLLLDFFSTRHAVLHEFHWTRLVDVQKSRWSPTLPRVPPTSSPCSVGFKTSNLLLRFTFVVPSGFSKRLDVFRFELSTNLSPRSSRH